jgi:uncharacterized protein (TIGR00661 family)
MAEHLRHRHRVIIYTSHDALVFLREVYPPASGIEIREAAGLRFHYTRGKLDMIKTVSRGLKYRWQLEEHLTRLKTDFRRDRPDLVITDFEPSVPRAAGRAGVPVVSLDHQHFLLTYDLSSLPRKLRAYAQAMGLFVRMFGIHPQKTVVSAFFFPPLRSGFEQIVQVGPLLRPFVRQTESQVGDHLLCYLRPRTPSRVVDEIVTTDRPLRIYGLGLQPSRGSANFRPIHEETFVEDLATSAGVVAGAGNQLLGEAMFFRKPVLAIPERKHHEQRINAHFLKQMGGGDSVFVENLQPSDTQQFLNRLETYRQNIGQSSHSFDGTESALREIEAFLNGVGG